MRFSNLDHEVRLIAKARNSFPWARRDEWGVTANAWDLVCCSGIEPHEVFCHPRVIADQPEMSAYYFAVTECRRRDIPVLLNSPVGMARFLNREISTQIELSKKPRQLRGLMRFQLMLAEERQRYNVFGDQGELPVKRLVFELLRESVIAVVGRVAGFRPFRNSMFDRITRQLPDIVALHVRRGYHVAFHGRPQISLRDANDLPLLAIEVKAGFDSAGALERFGAAMKSFDNDRNLNPRVKTVYVARCMTPELQKRISHNSPFDYTFGLSELMLAGKPRTTFANLVLRTMLGK